MELREQGEKGCRVRRELETKAGQEVEGWTPCRNKYWSEEYWRYLV